MQKVYLSVVRESKDIIYHRFVDESGNRKEERIKFKPFCGVESDSEDKSDFKSLFGKPLQLKRFNSISEFYSWKKDNEKYFDIHGVIDPETQFISLMYRNEIADFDYKKLKIFNFDIEVYCTKGFPNESDADWPVSAITIQDINEDIFYVFAWKEDYVNSDKRVRYFKCQDEKHLLKSFVDFIATEKPDILTGWDIDRFDITYLVNRINKELGATWVQKLSPVKKIKKNTFIGDFGKERVEYTILGITSLDYKRLYEKFQLEPRDSYSLENIAQVELGKGKLDYKSGENRSLKELFENDFKTYLDYNVQDVELVGKLENKLQYIRLAVEMTYKAKCNSFDKVYGTVNIWDAFLYNELLKKKKLAPPMKVNHKQPFPGGWVEEPERGLHGWCMVFDIASSYPNSIISYNISPECIIDKEILPEELIEISKRVKPKYGLLNDNETWIIGPNAYDVEKVEKTVTPLLKQANLCMTPWGEFFRRDFVGIIPEVVSRVFAERKSFKKKMKSLKETDPLYKIYNIKQGALKVFMNSLYGAMSNEWFRYFDIRMAGSITSAGQVSVKGVSHYLQNNIKDMKNIYTDTDSIFLDYEKYVKERFGENRKKDLVKEHDFCQKLTEKVVQPKIDEFFNRITDAFNCVQKTLSMEAEILADTWIIVEKKRYAMRIINNEGVELFDRKTGEITKKKLKVRGLSLIQSVTPEFARQKLKQTVELIFDVRDYKLVMKKFKEWKKEFIKLPFEEIAMPRSVTTFNKYVINSAGAQAHVRAALLYNRLIKEHKIDNKYPEIHEGDKIRYAYLKQPNEFNSDVIACLDKFPKELVDKLRIDWETQWDKCFLSQLEKIFEALNWKINDDNVGLEDFFV